MDRKPPIDVEDLALLAREQVLQNAPEHIRELGDVLRRSVEGDLQELTKFLQQHEVPFESQRLEELRDALIVQRIDLKDLEPEARARLRAVTLSKEDPSLATEDYTAAIANGETPRCRDCRWFVTAPRDGTEGGEKSCVEFGTKGVDVACRGFLNKISN